jgi:hypothetical protein
VKITRSDAIKMGAKGGSGVGAAWGHWQSSVGTEESLLRVQRNALFEAEQTKRRTAYEAWRNDVYARRLIGTQRNAFGVSGVDLSGSAIDDLVATMQELTLEKELAISEGKAERAVYKAEAYDAYKAARREKKRRNTGLFLDFLNTGLQMASVAGGAA